MAVLLHDESEDRLDKKYKVYASKNGAMLF